MKKIANHSASLVFALAGLSLAASSAYAQPANDDCSTPIPVFTGVTPVTNVGATSDGSVVCTTTNSEVYYVYVAEFSGLTQIDTCPGATFDTVLTVYGGCGGTVLACNDDFCGTRSRVIFDAIQGEPYIIRFASYRTRPTGTASLRIGFPQPTPINSFGFATPDPVFGGQSTLLQVEVTPGQFPESTGLVVTADTSSFIGGSASVALNDDALNGDVSAGDFVYSATLNVDPAEAAGFYFIDYEVTDDQGRTETDTIFLDVIALPQYFETGDAGDQIATAQTPTGTNPLASIGGRLDSGVDVDMYLVNICDLASFSVTADGNGTREDTQLFLFNPDGTGVTFNDDSEASGSSQSTLTNQFIPATGNYYLAISFVDVDAIDDAGNEIWADSPFVTERQPDGPGATSALAGWEGDSFTEGVYRLDFTGTCFPSSVNLCNYDYNQDENVDLTDAQLMAQVAAGIIAADPSWLSGDLNLDENADLTDAQQLAAFVASGVCPI